MQRYGRLVDTAELIVFGFRGHVRIVLIVVVQFGRTGRTVDDRRRDRYLVVRVDLQLTDHLPVAQVVAFVQSNVAVVSGARHDRAGDVPADSPHLAAVIVERALRLDVVLLLGLLLLLLLDGVVQAALVGRSVEIDQLIQLIALLVLLDRQDAHVFRGDTEQMERATDVRCERDVVHRVDDRFDRLDLVPFSRVLEVLEEYHFAADLVLVVAADGDHRRVRTRTVPGDRAQRYLAVQLVLRRPLTEQHHVGCLVDPNDAVLRAGGQQQAEMLRCEFDVGDRCATVHQCRTFHPVRLVALAAVVGHGELLPNGDRSIERAGR